MQPDLSAAARFLALLDPSPDAYWHFQTFDDTKARKAKALTTATRGTTLDAVARSLVSLNADGAGIFMGVNAHAPNGPRQQGTCNYIRALTVDLDGSPVGPMLNHACPPSLVVESSPDRFHGYWLIGTVEPNHRTHLPDLYPQAAYMGAQLRLAALFAGDTAISGTQHVLRLPGFMHTKGHPFQVLMLRDYGYRYTSAELLAAFPPLAAPVHEVYDDPDIFRGLLNDAQLARLLAPLDARDYGDNRTWFPMLCAAWYLTDGKGVYPFIAWSTSDPNYSGDAREISTRWKSLRRRPDKPITAATIVKALRDTATPEATEMAARFMDALDARFEVLWAKAMDLHDVRCLWRDSTGNVRGC